MKKINIISPIFNEESNLNRFYESLKIVKEKIKKNFEIKIKLFDDGSHDQSAELIKRLSKQDKDIKGIYFTKNFGHQAAIFAGLKEFDADYYAVLDADLQHNPELIETMLDNLIKMHDQFMQEMLRKCRNAYENRFKQTRKSHRKDVDYMIELSDFLLSIRNDKNISSESIFCKIQETKLVEHRDNLKSYKSLDENGLSDIILRRYTNFRKYVSPK